MLVVDIELIGCLPIWWRIDFVQSLRKESVCNIILDRDINTLIGSWTASAHTNTWLVALTFDWKQTRHQHTFFGWQQYKSPNAYQQSGLFCGRTAGQQCAQVLLQSSQWIRSHHHQKHGHWFICQRYWFQVVWPYGFCFVSWPFFYSKQWKQFVISFTYVVSWPKYPDLQVILCSATVFWSFIWIVSSLFMEHTFVSVDFWLKWFSKLINWFSFQ